MARDPQSADASASMGREVDALTTDVVFCLDRPTVPRTRDVLLNVSGLLWNPGPHVDPQRYRRTITDLRTALEARGRRVGLLAHVVGRSGADSDTATVESLGEDGTEVVVPTDLASVRDAVASAHLVIGSRMHACLNALSVGTPAVPLAYSRKFAPLLSHLGWDATVDLRSADDPVGDVLRLLDSEDLDAGVARLHARADAALHLADVALRRAV